MQRCESEGDAPGGSLRGVQEGSAGDLLRSGEDHSIEHLHGFDDNQAERRPGWSPTALSWIRPLLADLAVQSGQDICWSWSVKKGEHHEHTRNQAQILLAEAVVVLEMVSLVLEGVEGLVFDFPAGAACRA